MNSLKVHLTMTIMLRDVLINRDVLIYIILYIHTCTVKMYENTSNGIGSYGLKN